MAVTMKKLLTLVCLMALSQLPCHAQINWSSPPTTISTPGVNASDPQVVTDISGNVTSVWVENGVIQASTMSFGGSFGAITSISNMAATSSSPRLGIDATGNAYAIWLENGVVSYSTLPAGGSWSAEIAISNTGATEPTLAVDSFGNQAAIWTRNGFIESAQNPISVGTWGLVSQLSSNGTDDHPDIHIGEGGMILAIWHELISGTQDSIFSARGSVNQPWASPISVIAVTPGAHHNFPKVVVDQLGNATAVWFHYQVSGNAFSQVAAISSSLSSASSGWTPIPTQLSAGGLINPANLFLRLSIDANGNIVVVWVNSYDGLKYNVESSMLPQGGLWLIGGAPVLNNLYSFQSDLSVTSFGQAVIALMYYDGTDITIQSSDSGINGISFNFWSDFVNISQGTGNINPRVSAQYSSANGAIYAGSVWVSNNGTNNVIQAASGIETVIIPPSNVMITQGANNFGTFTEFFNTITWTPSPDPNVFIYVLYRNGIAFVNVTADQSQFVDHNAVQNQAVTYGIAAINSQNLLSPIATGSFP